MTPVVVAHTVCNEIIFYIMAKVRLSVSVKKTKANSNESIGIQNNTGA